MQRDPLHFLMSLYSEYGDVVRFRFGPEVLYLISHPRDLKRVFQENGKNYTKQTRVWQKLAPVFGRGLLTNDGDSWLRQRRIAQPAFHHERVAAIAAIVSGATAARLKQWQRHSTVDVLAEMMELTLDILTEALFGLDWKTESRRFSEAVNVVLHHINAQTRSILYYIPTAVPIPANLRFVRALHTVHEMVGRIIQDRRRSGGDRGDLLSFLMNARDAETGETMSDAQLMDEIKTFLVAGHETTANALAWTFFLLGKQPQTRRALTQEVARLSSRAPTLQDLPQLQLTGRVLRESMRLYPPVWFLGRRATQPDRLGEHALPAGAIVMPSFYVTHHRSDIWSDPEGFDPDRFLPDRFSPLPAFSFVPFGGGPRQCIGNEFALLEMQIVVAMLHQQTHLELLPEQVVEPEPAVTLRIKNGIKMRLIH